VREIQSREKCSRETCARLDPDCRAGAWRPAPVLGPPVEEAALPLRAPSGSVD